MKLPIIQNIMYGVLRPAQELGLNYRDLALKFSNPPENLEALEKLFVTSLGKHIDFNFQEEKPVYIGAIAPDRHTHLNADFINKTIPFPLSSPSNPKEKFYQNIVKAEVIRVKATLFRDAEIYKSDISTRSDVKDLLKQVLRYAKDLSSSTEVILMTMRTQLIGLYLDLCLMADDLLVANNDYLPFDELMYEVAQAYPSAEETDIYQSYISSLAQTQEKKNDDSALPSAEEYEETVIETNYNRFVKEVETYRFAELEKVKSLNKQQQSKLIHLIVENDANYAVPMLVFLGYHAHLKKVFSMSNAKIFVHWAKALGKSDRAVKGNYNAMNPESKEDKYRYNAGDFIAQVKMDYENL